MRWIKDAIDFVLFIWSLVFTGLIILFVAYIPFVVIYLLA